MQSTWVDKTSKHSNFKIENKWYSRDRFKYIGRVDCGCEQVGLKKISWDSGGGKFNIRKINGEGPES